MSVLVVVLVLKQPCFDLGLESIDVDIHVYSLKQPWFSLRKTSMMKIWDLKWDDSGVPPWLSIETTMVWTSGIHYDLGNPNHMYNPSIP